MWSRIGSLRESAERRFNTVRENARAAAQVAQEVLTAASIEDEPSTDQWELEQTHEHEAERSSDIFHEHHQGDLKNSEKNAGAPSLLPPPAPEPPQPPPPPPPTSDADLDASHVARKTQRRARYVVEGVQTAAGSSFRPPPRPGVYNDEKGEEGTNGTTAEPVPEPEREGRSYVHAQEPTETGSLWTGLDWLQNTSAEIAQTSTPNQLHDTMGDGQPAQHTAGAQEESTDLLAWDEQQKMLFATDTNEKQQWAQPWPSTEENRPEITQKTNIDQHNSTTSEVIQAAVQERQSPKPAPHDVANHNEVGAPQDAPADTDAPFAFPAQTKSLDVFHIDTTESQQEPLSIQQRADTAAAAAPTSQSPHPEHVGGNHEADAAAESSKEQASSEQPHYGASLGRGNSTREAALSEERDKALEQVSVLQREMRELHVAQKAGEELVSKHESALHIVNEDIKVLCLERDTAVAARELAQKELGDVKREAMQLRDEVADFQDDVHRAMAERDQARSELSAVKEEMEQVVNERDAAVESGHSGIREARNALEAIETERTTAEHRYSALVEELESLRAELQHIGEERNHAKADLEQLQLKCQVDGEAFASRFEESERQLAGVKSELAAVKAERDDAVSRSAGLLEEHRRLLNGTQKRSDELTQRERELRELERALRASSAERDDETLRLEGLTVQLSQIQETMEATILERNQLHEERTSLSNELQNALSDASIAKAKTAETERNLASATMQKDESDARIKQLLEELDSTRAKYDSVMAERDTLVRERATAVRETEDLPDAMKALTEECERKTSEVAALQRQLRSSAAKMEKLTAKKNTIQRQRDDAGARLSAAGAEFAALHAKLKKATSANAEANSLVQQLQTERDEARAKVAELAVAATREKALDDALTQARSQLQKAEAELDLADQRFSALEEVRNAAQNELNLAGAELKTLGEKHAVAARECEQNRIKNHDSEKRERKVQDELQSEREALLETKGLLSKAQAELLSSEEGSQRRLNALQLDLDAERERVEQSTGLLVEAQTSLAEKERINRDVRSSLEGAMRLGRETMQGAGWSDADLPDSIANALSGRLPTDDLRFAQTFGSVYKEVCGLLKNAASRQSELQESAQAWQERCEEQNEKSKRMDNEMTALNVKLADLNEEHAKLEASERSLAVLSSESSALISRLESENSSLRETVEASTSEAIRLQKDLEGLAHKFEAQQNEAAQFSVEERNDLLETLNEVTAQLKTLLSLVRGNLSEEAIDEISRDHEVGEDGNATASCRWALRGVAAMVAELGRLQASNFELEEKLVLALGNVEQIAQKTELAERERDSARAARDRWERESANARQKGLEEGAAEMQDRVRTLEEEIFEAQQDNEALQQSLQKSETESTELRALCSKLTTQFNSRTNELDDAEEKLAYLQDQVASLEEDLEVAHHRAQSGEEQSAEARRAEVERLTRLLEESQKQADALAGEAVRLREDCDKAKRAAKENELLAETHRTAEENLQIAIEQLEAEQESAIKLKTMELEKKLGEAVRTADAAKEKIVEANQAVNKLSLRDEEIVELRTALGRLADERVELKLELEKSLSRLNHPDGGGQFVDRRVIRQLLVNYFRVGSARRRDVLELMSRMLAFSDADLVAVGLKRRALMERIGSFVQPPDLDGNSLPPLGTVSEKWIEFLLKETEEEEEDF